MTFITYRIVAVQTTKMKVKEMTLKIRLHKRNCRSDNSILRKMRLTYYVNLSV